MNYFGVLIYGFLLFGRSSLHVAAADEGRTENWGDVILGMLPESLQKVFTAGAPDDGQKLLSEADRLVLEAPRQGFVSAGQSAVLKLSLPSSDGVFPDILLTLSTINSGGDADLYCVPPPLFNYANLSPGPDLNVWKSHHSHGEDMIFISKSHEVYDSAKTGMDDDKINATGVEFICSVVGFAAGGTEYIVEVEVDYSGRSLVPEERNVIHDIYDSCCGGKPGICRSWMSDGIETGGIDPCHVPGNICNSDGRLVRLDMRDMGLECNFPNHVLGDLPFVKKVTLANNLIQGDVKHMIAALSHMDSKIQHLDISDNLMSGDLMDEANAWCQLAHASAGLKVLNVARNKLKGSIPKCIFDEGSKLAEFVYDGNRLIGSIPDIPKDSVIRGLGLSSVGLSGTIPDSLFDLGSLVELDLSSNSLQGTVPEGVGTAPSIRFLDLHSNKLNGLVPRGIAASLSLEVVNLDSNVMSGLSEGWYEGSSMEFSALRQLHLAHNMLQGPFPTALVAAPSLSVLDIRDNQISGLLPDVSDMMPNVVVFLGGGNRFEGTIPLYWGGMSFFSKKALASSPFEPRLDLSHNRLSGQVPSFMHIGNVPRSLWSHIYLGGNEFEFVCPLEHYLIHISDLWCDKPVAHEHEEIDIIVKDSIHKYLPRTVNDVDIFPEAERAGSDAEYIKSTLQSIQAEDNLPQDMKEDTSESQSSSFESTSNRTLVSLVIGGVLGGSILAGMLGMFLYRWYKRHEWDKAVDAALVRDLELGPKINQVNAAFMKCPGTPDGMGSM